MSKSKSPGFTPGSPSTWRIKKSALPSLEQRDKQADKLYKERLMAPIFVQDAQGNIVETPGETEEWADHLVLRYRMARMKRRLAEKAA